MKMQDFSVSTQVDQTPEEATAAIVNIRGWWCENIEGDKNTVRFTHAGLVPNFNCYEVCSKAWTYYITKSLNRFITTGKGDPIRKATIK